MKQSKNIFGAIIAAGIGLSSLTGCVSTKAEPEKKTTSNLAADNLENYIAASFDNIYDGKYHTYNVMYEGIPSSVEYFHQTGYRPLISIFFDDEAELRNIVAYCHGGCYIGENYFPSDIAYNRIKNAQDNDLPVRIYGKQDGPTILITSISYLIGPGRWQNIELTTDTGYTYPTPTPQGGQ